MLMRITLFYRKWKAAILLLTGLGLVSLLGFVSLGTDLGIVYKRRAELQKGVNAAALAASTKMDEIRNQILTQQSGNMEWNSQYTQMVKNAAKSAAKENGVTLKDSDIQLIPPDFPTKVKVSKDEQVNLFFAKLINVKSINVHVEAESQNQLLSSVQYDLMPWGIPDFKVVQTGNLQYSSTTGHFNGFSIDGSQLKPGNEYLLKLGAGVPDADYNPQMVGGKILVPMGNGDQSSDLTYKKAYGFIYWCLQHGFPVEWLLNYRGGAFLLDYRGDFFTGKFAPEVVLDENTHLVEGTKFKGVKFEIIDPSNVSSLYKQAYKVVYMDHASKIAVYTHIPDYESNVLPLGIDYRQDLVDGRVYTLKYNSGQNVQDGNCDKVVFDETGYFRPDDEIDETDINKDLNGDGKISGKVKVKDITTCPIKMISGGKLMENTLFKFDDELDESVLGMDLNGDGVISGLVKIWQIKTKKIRKICCNCGYPCSCGSGGFGFSFGMGGSFDGSASGSASGGCNHGGSAGGSAGASGSMNMGFQFGSPLNNCGGGFGFSMKMNNSFQASASGSGKVKYYGHHYGHYSGGMSGSASTSFNGRGTGDFGMGFNIGGSFNGSASGSFHHHGHHNNGCHHGGSAGGSANMNMGMGISMGFSLGGGKALGCCGCNNSSSSGGDFGMGFNMGGSFSGSASGSGSAGCHHHGGSYHGGGSMGFGFGFNGGGNSSAGGSMGFNFGGNGSVNASGGYTEYDFDETHLYNPTDELDEEQLGIDLDGNGVILGKVQVININTVPIQEVSAGGFGLSWDEMRGHYKNYKIKEWLYNMDLNGDGDTNDKIKIKKVTNYPIKKVGHTYYLDANRDGDYDDVVSNWGSKYKVDLNGDGYFQTRCHMKVRATFQQGGSAGGNAGGSASVSGNVNFEMEVKFGFGWGQPSNGSTDYSHCRFQLDLNDDGKFDGQYTLAGGMYQVDLNGDGDYNDQVESCAGGSFLPGPGNFGALAIDGVGAQVFEESLKNGCETKLSVGDTVKTQPGNMAGPTVRGIDYRISHGKTHVLLPIVNTMDVNGRKEVIIVGFAAFDLIDSYGGGNGNNASATIKARYVDLDRLKRNAEDVNREVVARALTQANIPFDWIHDHGVISGKLYNYDWLHSHHEDSTADVARAIAKWASDGGFCFAMCWITERLDVRINEYNQINGTSVPTFAFKPAYLNVDDRKCRVDDNDTKGFRLDTNYNNMDIFELMAVQNHKNYIPGYGGKTNSFAKAAVKDTGVRILGNIDYNSCKYVAGPYGKGRFTFLAGHDPRSTEGYRLILDNIFAATQIEKDWGSGGAGLVPNYGCLDLNSIESDKDEAEYYSNILLGYKVVDLKKGDYVYTLPGNIAGYTNIGVTFRYDHDKNALVKVEKGEYVIKPEGSVRGIVVPVVEPAPTTSDQYYGDNSTRKVIYDLKGRTRVKIKGLALFLLRDINQQNPIDSGLSVNPDDSSGKGIYNGQVRGIFVKYIEIP